MLSDATVMWFMCKKKANCWYIYDMQQTFKTQIQIINNLRLGCIIRFCGRTINKLQPSRYSLRIYPIRYFVLNYYNTYRNRNYGFLSCVCVTTALTENSQLISSDARKESIASHRITSPQRRWTTTKKHKQKHYHCCVHHAVIESTLMMMMMMLISCISIEM